MYNELFRILCITTTCNKGIFTPHGDHRAIDGVYPGRSQASPPPTMTNATTTVMTILTTNSCSHCVAHRIKLIYVYDYSQ